MRIATWNVNSVTARLPYLLGWLEARQPDVVCLQELKTPTGSFPSEPLRALGYAAFVHGQRQWNGVAVLVRGQGELRQTGLPGHEPSGARLVTAQAAGWEVTSVYVPNGKSLDHPDYQRKLEWLAALREHLRGRTQAPERLLVAGDFNVTPADLDTYDSKGLRGQIHHTEAERQAIGMLLALGLRDLYRQAHPDEPGFTWWDYRAGALHRNLGLRIDLLLGSASAAERLRDAWVDREWRRKQGELVPSDHAPLIADFD